LEVLKGVFRGSLMFDRNIELFRICSGVFKKIKITQVEEVKKREKYT